MIDIFQEITLGNVRKCNKYLRNSTDINERRVVRLPHQIDKDIEGNDFNISYLHYAVYVNQVQIVKFLLAKNINVNLEDNYKMTALFYAIQCRVDPEITNLLIDYGTDINHRNIFGKTPLHLATEKGDTKTVEILLEHGAHINCWCNQNYTPLHIAESNNYAAIVSLFLTYGANVNYANALGFTLLYWSIRNRYLNITTELLKLGANVNVVHNEVWAFANGTALGYAISLNDYKYVSLLLKYGANVNQRGLFNKTALHSAAIETNENILNILLPLIENVNVQDDFGNTPLNKAVAWKKIKNCRLLLKHNADCNISNLNAITPLHHALDCNNSIVNLLLKYGADVNIYFRNTTPLHCAVEKKDDLCVNLLLYFGADINLKSLNDERTVLQVAIDNGYTSIVELILIQIMRLLEAKKYVSPENMQYFDSEISSRGNSWKKEIIKLRNKIICKNYNVSFYDILLKCGKQNCTLLINSDVISALKHINYCKKFPRFSGLLQFHIRKCIEKVKLVKQNSNIIRFILNQVSVLPLEINMKIASYLNDVEKIRLRDEFKNILFE